MKIVSCQFEVLGMKNPVARGEQCPGVGDDEQFVERRAFAVEAVEAAGDGRPSFAGAGAGHDEDVAARGDRLPLGRRERIVLGARRFHACGNFSHR